MSDERLEFGERADWRWVHDDDGSPCMLAGFGLAWARPIRTEGRCPGDPQRPIRLQIIVPEADRA